MQRAFLEHDAFQCGYCTPGQIMSAVAVLEEGHAGSDSEIAEFMSGNICRCGAYPNILAAIRQVSAEDGTVTVRAISYTRAADVRRRDRGGHRVIPDSRYLAGGTTQVDLIQLDVADVPTVWSTSTTCRCAGSGRPAAACGSARWHG